jgi:hypothetical protein
MNTKRSKSVIIVHESKLYVAHESEVLNFVKQQHHRSAAIITDFGEPSLTSAADTVDVILNFGNTKYCISRRVLEAFLENLSAVCDVSFVYGCVFNPSCKQLSSLDIFVSYLKGLNND